MKNIIAPEQYMEWVYFFTSTAGMSLAAAGLTLRLKPRSFAEYILLWLTLFVLSIILVALVTALAGIYLREVVAVISCVIGAIGVFWARKHRPEGLSAGSASHWSWSFSAVLSLLVAPFLVRLISPNLPQRAYDDFSYQGPAAFEFVIEGGLGFDGRLRYHAFFPFNAELFASWLHLPTHSDTYWWLVGAIWAALAALAVYVLARRLKATPLASGLAALSVLASRGVVREWATHTATDLAVAALFLSMLVLADDVRRCAAHESMHMRIVRMLLCGACAGGILGMKIAFAPVFVLLAIWLVVVTRGSELQWRGIIAFLAASVTLGSFWYVRNWFITGNPLYPAEFGPFWGPFDPASQQRTTLAPWLWGEFASLKNWKKVILGYGNQNGLLILFPMLGIILQAMVLLRRHKRLPQSLHWLILMAALILIAFFPFIPFYGTANNPNASIGVRPRFVIGIFALGAILLAPHLHGRWRIVAAFACVFSALGMQWLIAGAILWVTALVVQRLRIAVSRRSVQDTTTGLSRPSCRSTMAAVVLVWLVLAVGEPCFTQRTNDKLLSYVCGGTHFGDAWRRINQLPAGARIGTSGFRGNFILGLYGRKLQHAPVALYKNGSAFNDRFYELWARVRRDKRWWKNWHPDPLPTLENLYNSGLDYVLVTRQSDTPRRSETASQQRNRKWPQLRAVLQNARASRIAKGKGWELWKLPSSAPGV